MLSYPWGDWDEITDVRSWGAAESWIVKEIVIQITRMMFVCVVAYPDADLGLVFCTVSFSESCAVYL
jgi:hypothetical protein